MLANKAPADLDGGMDKLSREMDKQSREMNKLSREQAVPSSGLAKIGGKHGFQRESDHCGYKNLKKKKESAEG